MTHGNAPGPCNMHSADLAGRTIYIFRGGDGKDYLNDLHSFNVGKKLIFERSNILKIRVHGNMSMHMETTLHQEQITAQLSSKTVFTFSAAGMVM